MYKKILMNRRTVAKGGGHEQYLAERCGSDADFNAHTSLLVVSQSLILCTFRLALIMHVLQGENNMNYLDRNNFLEQFNHLSDKEMRKEFLNIGDLADPIVEKMAIFSFYKRI